VGRVITAAIAVASAPTALRAWRHGVRFEYLFMRPSGAQLEELVALVTRGALHPVIDRTYPLDRAAEALAYVESGRARGKVVLTVP
jgi:NADPH:quinone reductase-like Zn-dependent oxidoreductase